MKAILIQWMLLGLGLVLLLLIGPIPTLGDQNAHPTPSSAPVASSTSPGLPPSTKTNTTVTTSPMPPIQIMQTLAKSTNSTELYKELEKPLSKGNTTMENLAKGRKVKITETPTVHPVADPKTATSTAPSSPSTPGNSTKTTINTKQKGQEQFVAEGVSSSDIGNSTQTTKSGNATASTSPTKSTTTTTTTTTTSTTTARPGKPKVAFAMDVHPEWEKNRDLPLAASGSGSSVPSSTLPEPDPPIAQPSLELSGNLADRGGNQYIVPLVTVLLTVPLAIGVTIVMYRRFREMWSTRHYRRMDFLVDGMYND